MKQGTIALLAYLGAILCVAGCRVNVEKGANGDEKKVQVETPFGGIRVKTGQTSAADVGLPAYPGAQLVSDDDNHRSADVRMGFGEWEMHVQVATYSTRDHEDRVAAFYRKALGSYGDVIVCRDGAPVETETKTPQGTPQGLTCSDHGHRSVTINDHGHIYGYQPEHGGLELRVGTERHQHIVAFQNAQPGQTRFALVALDLPANSGKAAKSD